MDKFLGSWTIDRSKSKVDVESFIAIQHIKPNPKMAELLSKSDPIVTLAKEGDGFTLATKLGDISFKQGPFKIGEDKEIEDPINGRTLVNRVEVEGDKLRTKTTVKGTDISWTALRYLDGDTLVSELSGSGKAITEYMKRA